MSGAAVHGELPTNNPYRAPNAPVGDVAPPGENSPRPPRPRAVVFTIVFGWVFLAFGVYATANTTYHFVTGWTIYRHMGSAYVAIAWRAALVVCILIMLVSLQRRGRLGRWLGAVFIGSLEAYFLYLMIRSPGGNFAYRVGSYMAGLFLFCGPIAWWFYNFTLSRKARTWFNRAPAPDAPR